MTEFLVPNITAWLIQLSNTEELEHKYRLKDDTSGYNAVNTFFKVPRKPNEHHQFVVSIRELDTSFHREVYLMKHCKRLYAEALRVTNRFHEWDCFMNSEKNNPKFMSAYIEDYLKPKLFKMRREGRLKKGKKKVQIQNVEVNYEGEMDEKGLATGFGKATYSHGFVEGMFYEDCTQGVCILHWSKGRRVGERKNSLLHGKMTLYQKDGRIFNYFMKENDQVHVKEITSRPKLAFYSSDGEVLRALDLNWANCI